VRRCAFRTTPRRPNRHFWAPLDGHLATSSVIPWRCRHCGRTYPETMRRRAIALLVTAVAGVSLVACGGGGKPMTRGSTSARSLSVPLIEFHRGNAVSVFVGLTFAGHLYYFLVDTGAERTIIDAPVARRLGLRAHGSPREFAPLGCRVRGQPVLLRDWRLGDTPLPAITAFSHKLLTPPSFSRLPFGGLLGSDVLSRFKTVTIDFTHRRLTLRSKPPTSGRAVPIAILRRAGSVLATTQVDLDNHSAQFVVDTGAETSLIDSAAAAQLRLAPAGPSENGEGAVCRVAVTPVFVRRWSVADLRIPRAVIGRVPVVVGENYLNRRIAGIVGTSTLARRGTLTIDFPHSRMTLGGTKS
jgi:predicted aspartyl protease